MPNRVPIGTSVPINIPRDHHLEQVRDYKENNWAPFSGIGPIRNQNSYYRNDPDIFDIINRLTKGASDLFVQLKYEMDLKNNLVCYPVKNNTKSGRSSFSRALNQLIDAKLIKKALNNPTIKKLSIHFEPQTYMINPYLIKCREYDRALGIWDCL
jgi:hypothetical protein